jgi:hypothetical protein
MSKPIQLKVVPMPPPEPEDGILFTIGDDAFRVTAHVEKVAKSKPGGVVRIDGAKKQPD